MWVDRGSTAVFLSHHYSPLFFSLSASHSSALWLRRSGGINKGGPHSFTSKHTLAAARTQDNVRGSSPNAIKAREIRLPEREESNIHSPGRKWQRIQWQDRDRGRGDAGGGHLIVWLRWNEAPLSEPHSDAERPQKSQQKPRWLLRLNSSFPGPCMNLHLVKVSLDFLPGRKRLHIFSSFSSTLKSVGFLPSGALHCCHSDRIRQRQACL